MPLSFETNQRLHELYSRCWDDIGKWPLETHVALEVSNPLFVNAFQEYLSSRVRVLVVGQESQGTT